MEQVQINVRVPHDWKAAIEEAATKKKLSVNEFLQLVIQKSLPERGKGLSAPRRRGRPARQATADD